MLHISKFKKNFISIFLLAIVLIITIFTLKQFISNDKTKDNNPITEKTTSRPAIGVASMQDNDWFNTWANKDDMTVYFGNELDFSQIKRPPIGKVAWNVPNFSTVIKTKNLWLNKIDVIIYDYEMWDNTPQDEKDNPDVVAKTAQSFADENSKEFIFGTSWRMAVSGISVTEIRKANGNIDWSKYLDKDRIMKIVSNVNNYGVNATGLRDEFPNAYVDFINAITDYAVQVNPDINIVPVLDTRSTSAEEMFNMYKSFKSDVKLILIMGTVKDQPNINKFINIFN
ncbi:hypothetical protein A2V49_04665 [candidate division WWE3 bacterium RBG_19FT_COMBO_34_6]|uniref:Glycoside-hydrolase family GH114 TIM-barrel domain-containing protein n=1 Tax=candidate division WWE3 bacterium RBG_19FT_COMBO_34_6 TaxID=1802612 RepID=A0A1F4UMR3_UNCKA|nr:MAG: hypothetical protein A2V49_04665 [candidate division WWE3 bacterium RBG_19FT_COMBO_34_6]